MTFLLSPERYASDFWAITAYFNPAGYRRRLENYRVFRERLMVPLVAVELAYRPTFELTEDDAEVLVQLRGHDIMWQKERLLNLALRTLPGHCRNVVWVDCDILFENDAWPERVSRLLQHCMILQPFSRVHDLPRDWIAGDLRPALAEVSRAAVTFAIASNVPTATCLGNTVRNIYAKGFTWAARRELLDRHGFFDAGIIGGGDRTIAGAIYGCFEQQCMITAMNHRQRVQYLSWAEPFHETIGGAVGYMDGDIYHLWHGEISDRRYHERHEAFARFEFDPFSDIAIADNGAWRWNTNKREMHEHVRDYFASRREDG